MKLHELKIQHKYLEDIRQGKKTFELRKNDRDYQVGDLIKFIDIDKPEEEKTEDNNERHEITFGQDPFLASYANSITISYLYEITYILKDVPEFGLDYDYCIFGIKKVKLISEG